MYAVHSSRVERVWDFAQYYDLAMYRKRVHCMGHQHIHYVIEVPDTGVHSRLLLEHSQYLTLV